MRHRYLTTLALIMLAAIVLVAAANVVIDPYGHFRIFRIVGINTVKPYPDRDLLDVKRSMASATEFNALILGNSRVEVGLDPEHPAFRRRGLETFNFGLPGSSLATAWQVLEEQQRKRTLKLVIVGVEFLDFLTLPSASIVRLEPFRTGIRARLTRLAATTISARALADTIKTLAAQRDPYAATLTDRGFNPLHEYDVAARADGYHALFRQRAQENARAYVAKPKSVRGAGGLPGPDFGTLRQLLRAARTETHIIIYPYHAQLLLMLDEAGLWPAFEDWKRLLIDTIESERSEGRIQWPVTIWDFSGFHDAATEVIPAPGDRDTVVKWYWEGGHFKKALGDRVIDQMLGEQGVGVRLESASIDAHLDDLRAALQAYAARHVEQANEVSGLVDAARRGR